MQNHSSQEIAKHIHDDPKITNAVIEEFNKEAARSKSGRQMRIETDSPCIYVIVVNKPILEINRKKVLMVKVGFTQVSIKKVQATEWKKLFTRLNRNSK